MDSSLSQWKTLACKLERPANNARYIEITIVDAKVCKLDIAFCFCIAHSETDI